MNRFARQAFLALAILLAINPCLYAQGARDPHIGYCYPAGGQQGNYFEAVIGGQYIKDVSEVYVSGEGVKAEIVKWYRPFTQGQAVGLGLKIRFTRERMEEEAKKKGKTEPITDEMVYKEAGVTENDLKELEIYRKRDADPKRQPNDQIAEELTVKFTVDPNAEPGKRELRVINADAMSNPVWFHVNRWPECRETEPNELEPDPVIGSTIPVVVNGQIMPGDVDRFSFTARKGMRLILDAAVREVMPYLADAVPGWFQGVLALYDADGAELAYAGAFYYRQDPVIYYEIPEDGNYVVEIRDSIYRGREDFVYRITIGELPFVTGIFPLGARAGTEVAVELQGWNLAGKELNVRAVVDRNRPVRWYSIPQADKLSIDFPLRIDMINEMLDQEPNDKPETAQEITLPVIVNGRIDQPDDREVFRFNGYGKVVAEVFARRGGSPVDASLAITDADGKEVGFNDDFVDKAYPLITHHADPRLEVTLPGSGTYYLHLNEAQRKGGQDFIYRLYVRPPRPDFDLRVVPSTIKARPGQVVPITAYALRRDDFNDDIQLSLVNPPDGFQLDGAIIPSGADKIGLTLTIPENVDPEPIHLEMDGQAVGGHGQKLRMTRPVIPAENMMQAFIWYQLVTAENWTVVVSGKRGAKAPVEFSKGPPLKLKLGEKNNVPVLLANKTASPAELGLELIEPPDGVKVEKVVPEGRGLIATIEVDAEKVKPGLRGNLLFTCYRETKPAATKEQPSPQPVRQSYGLIPAVPFEVVGKAPRK
ncbi:MAG: peptidase [Rhodopirellula sp.]|nr:peptidase [Rhodopirellula sp.]